jgi:hypothetical protein
MLTSLQRALRSQPPFWMHDYYRPALQFPNRRVSCKLEAKRDEICEEIACFLLFRRKKLGRTCPKYPIPMSRHRRPNKERIHALPPLRAVSRAASTSQGPDQVNVLLFDRESNAWNAACTKTIVEVLSKPGRSAPMNTRITAGPVLNRHEEANLAQAPRTARRANPGRHAGVSLLGTLGTRKMHGHSQH